MISIAPLNRARDIFLIIIVLMVLLLVACGEKHKQSEKAYTVGVVNFTSSLDPALEGFKVGMAALGYNEGKNIVYNYAGPVGHLDALQHAIQDLMAQEVDLILALSTPAALQAKQSIKETEMPVVFLSNDPVESGIVESISHPGVNFTGIEVRGFVPKELKWLLTIVPDTKRVFVPHNPDDGSSSLGLEDLNTAATSLGVELVVYKARTAEEMKAGIAALPEKVDAILLLPDNLVISLIDDFVAAAIELKLPLVSISWAEVQSGALISFGFDFFESGKQASHLADRILKGNKPADLPAETAEYFLSINLQTANKLGIEISTDVLMQATNVIPFNP